MAGIIWPFIIAGILLLIFTFFLHRYLTQKLKEVEPVIEEQIKQAEQHLLEALKNE